MSKIAYVDFDLLLDRSGETYSARVLNSPAGEIKSDFQLPFSEIEIENVLLKVGRTRRGVRRLESPEMETARIFGARLFEAVFGNEIRGSLRAAMNEAYRQGKGIRIKLHLTGVPELADLPWEYLYDPISQRFLVLSVETPLIRYVDLPLNIQPLPVSPPLRVLVMISSPRNHPPLDVDLEWRKLKEAVEGLESQGMVSLTRTDDATLLNLQRMLRRDEYHVFHFVGHGTFDRQAQDGMLLFEDDHDLGRPVSGRQLGTILHDHRSLRLAILNSCEGARTSRDDPFAGAGQSLVQQGIPAVIAMQFEITDQAAIILAREFYGAVADGYPVDAALSEARKALYSQGNDVEWGTPVLYLRTKDGQVFDISGAKETPAVRPPDHRTSPLPEPERTQDSRLEQRLSQLYTDGLSSFWLEEWDAAARNFQAALDLNPNYRDAGAKLEATRRQQRLAALYRQAVQAEADGDWDTAAATLGSLTEEAPDYKDAKDRLQAVNQRKRLADLYAETRQLYQAQKWQAVVNVFGQITALDPSYPDPEGYLSGARRELERERKEAELDQLYTSALAKIEAGDWQAAKKTLGRVISLQPDYRDASRLKGRVEAELSQKATRPQPSSRNRPRNRLRAIPEIFSAAGPQVQAAARQQAQPVSISFARQTLLFAAGLAGVRAIIFLIAKFAYSNNPDLGFFGLAVAGSLIALVILRVLRKSKINIPIRETLILIGGWAASLSLILTVIYVTPSEWYGDALPYGMALACAAGGLATGIVLKRNGYPLSNPGLAALTAGWALGGLVGEIVFYTANDSIYSTIYNVLGDLDDVPFYVLGSLLGGAVIGLAGGWITLLSINPQRDTKSILNTTVRSVIGFGLGAVVFFLLNLNNDNPLQLSISIGLLLAIGALSITYSGRITLRNVLFLLFVAFGTMAIVYVSLTTGADAGLAILILGIFFGLCLGLSTRQILAAVLLATAGMGVMAFTNWLFPQSSTVLFLPSVITAAIWGGALGPIYTSLKNTGPSMTLSDGVQSPAGPGEPEQRPVEE